MRITLLVAGWRLGAQARPAPLDTVVVVASRTGAGGVSRTVDVIRREAIEQSPAHNLAELLSERLGVDVYGRSAAQADISLRGATSEQTLVLIDGVRASDAQSSHYTLDLTVPLTAIERVEILHGAGSALYGPDAVGGVINIVTRRDASGPSVSGTGGAFGTVGGAASATLSRRLTDIRASGDFAKSDGFRAGTDYRMGTARVALTTPAGGGSMAANIGVGVRDFGANTFYGPYNSTERTGSVTADARWDARLGGWQLSVSASGRRHTDRFTLVRDNPAIYENLHESWQSAGSIVARTRSGPMWFAAGADAANAQLSSSRLGSRREWRGAVFAEGTIGSEGGASLALGVREDRSDLNGAFVSPSVGITVPLCRTVTMRASGARGFRAPTWTERYYADPANAGNPALVPERFWSGDLSVRLVTANGLAIGASGYVRRAENLIDWVKPDTAPAGSLWKASNIGTATYRGAEATLALPRSRLATAELFASGLVFADGQGAGLTGKYALRPITRQLGARARLAFAPSLSGALELVQARRAAEDAHVTGNARVAWRGGSAGVTLDIRNVTNATWLDASGQPVAGRGAWLTLAWRCVVCPRR